MSWVFRITARTLGLRRWGGPLAPPAGHAQTASGEAVPPHEFVQRYCVACHSDRGFRARRGARVAAGARRGGCGRARGDLGERPAAGAQRDDAPARGAAAGRRDARRVGRLAGDGARPCGGRPSAPRTADDGAPPEPRRVPQRRPRPAGAGRRHRGPAAAGRRRRRGLRQQRRGAVGLDDADGALPDGGPAHQPARAGRPGACLPVAVLPGGGARGAGRPHQRGPSVSDRGAALPCATTSPSTGSTSSRSICAATSTTTSAASATCPTSSTCGWTRPACTRSWWAALSPARALRDELLRLRERRVSGVGQLLGHRGRGALLPDAGPGRDAARGAGVPPPAGPWTKGSSSRGRARRPSATARTTGRTATRPCRG